MSVRQYGHSLSSASSSARRNLLTAETTRKSTNAIARKLITALRNAP